MPKSKIRKLTSVGASRSRSVVIPAAIIQALGWRTKQRLIIKKISGAVIIRDAKTKHRKK
ncbi:MAG: hypothetical protein ABI643_02640 [Candidatus Doudnabacteria bacterium]